MQTGSLIPPQIHTFCMETEEADVAYVASRLFYAAVAAGQETESPDTVNRQKYENLAKALIPTLSIRRPSPIAEGQVCKALGSHPPVLSHAAFTPATYAEVPTMENPQSENDAKELAQQSANAEVQASSVKAATPPTPTDTKKTTKAPATDPVKTDPLAGDSSHLD